jgi:hypothetical protein
MVYIVEFSESQRHITWRHMVFLIFVCLFVCLFFFTLQNAMEKMLDYCLFSKYYHGCITSKFTHFNVHKFVFCCNFTKRTCMVYILYLSCKIQWQRFECGILIIESSCSLVIVVQLYYRVCFRHMLVNVRRCALLHDVVGFSLQIQFALISLLLAE